MVRTVTYLEGTLQYIILKKEDNLIVYFNCFFRERLHNEIFVALWVKLILSKKGD